MTRHRILIASLCLVFAQVVHAESLGTYGRAYPIKERDAIDAMKDAVRKKLANGGKEQMIKGAKDRYLASLRNVTTPSGITPARATTTRLVDLTETVKKTITDGRGNVVVAAGTKIIGAVHVPYSQLKDRIGTLALDKTKPLVVYCARGQRSMMAGSTLKAAGFTQLYNLNGGFKAWAEAGLPVEKVS